MASQFHTPKRIITGGEAHKQLNTLKELGNKKRVILISDDSRVDPNVKTTCCKKIAGMGIEVIEAEPIRTLVSDDMLSKLLNELKPAAEDVILAVGGTKAIQAGKILSLMATNGEEVLEATDLISGIRPSLIVIAIAMTAGSGAAISHCSCYLDTKTQTQRCFSTPFLMPEVAILDPGLSGWQSPNEIALDGVVSLSYAIEAVVSITSTPVTDACALAAITGMSRWLPVAFAHGGDLAAREQVMFAQQLVSMAMGNCSPNVICKIAGQIEAHTKIPKGNVMGAILPHYLEFFTENYEEKVSAIAEALRKGDLTTADTVEPATATEYLKQFIQRLDLPTNLSFLGMEELLISEVTQEVSCRMADGQLIESPIKNRLEEILRRAL